MMQNTPVVNFAALRAAVFQADKQSDEAIKEKVFSALVMAVKTIQQERATILNALVRMRMRYSSSRRQTNSCILLRRS